MVRGNSPDRRNRIAVYTKEWRSSGTGLIAQELAFALADIGGDVMLIAPEPEDARFQAAHPGVTAWRTLRAADGAPSRLTRARASVGRFARSALGVLGGALSRRVLIVNIPDPLALSGPLLAIVKLFGGRIIYIVHDPLPHAWRLAPALRGLERAVYGLPLGLADRLVVLTPPARDTLTAAFGVRAEKIAVIEHGVFARAEPGPAPGLGELLLFGSLRRNKGVREAIEGVVAARAAGAQVRLRIAGAPHQEDLSYWAACAALARAHPEAVTLEIGFVENHRLDALIATCDAFLMPYRDFNSQSGVAVLAASNARPVIATAQGGIGELLREGMAGETIDHPGDGPAVAGAIARFLDQSLETRRAAAHAYRARMLATRDWASVAKAYAGLVSELAR